MSSGVTLKRCVLWASLVAQVLFAPVNVSAAPAGKPLRLAVVELRNAADLTADETAFLTDVTRSQVTSHLASDRFLMMTRESIRELLPPGVSLADCAKGQCEVEVGRMIGADYIFTGEVLKFGTSLRLNLKVHHCSSGAFLGSASARAADLDTLETRLADASTTVAALVRRHAGLEPAPEPKAAVEQSSWRSSLGSNLAPEQTRATEMTMRSWAGVGEGLNGSVLTLAYSPQGTLFAGGSFSENGARVAIANIAQFKDGHWSPLAEGLSGPVRCIAFDAAGMLYAGGKFIAYAETSEASNIAKWDGKAWTAMGGGVNGVVNAICVTSAGTVVIGGRFRIGDSKAQANLAAWDGNGWAVLGRGVDGEVLCLAEDRSGGLFVGGNFGRVGERPCGNIARWTGASWQTVGGGLKGTVAAIVIGPNGVVTASGTFKRAGELIVNGIASWDGEGWVPLGSGIVSDGLSGLAERSGSGAWALLHGPGDILYVAGGFIVTSARSINCIARWKMGAWQSVGTGAEFSSVTTIRAMVLSPDGSVVVGGDFTKVDGAPALHVAQWGSK